MENHTMEHAESRDEVNFEKGEVLKTFMDKKNILIFNPKQLEDKEHMEKQSFSEENELKEESLPLHTKTRKYIIKMHRSTLYRKFMIFLMVLFTLSITLRDPDPTASLNQTTDLIEKVLHCLFLIAFTLKLIALPKFRYGFLVIEVISLLSGLTILFLEEEEVLKYIRAVRCLRLLLFLEIAPMKNPFNGLLKGTKNLAKLLIPALFVIYIYSIVGFYSFSGLEYSRCRDVENLKRSSDWTFHEGVDYLCGERQCPEVEGVTLQCLNPLDYGVEPNKEEVNSRTFGYGLLTYDNIFLSLFNTLKLAFITGWSRTAILMKQGMSELFVKLYYLSFLYLFSYVYMSIIYGIMMSNEQENNPKKLSYIQKNEAKHHHETDLTDKSEKSEKRGKYGEYLLVFQSKGNELLSPSPSESEKEEEMNSTGKFFEKKFIYLHRYYYLPENEEFRNFWIKFTKAYNVFNNLTIVACCLNLAIDFKEEPYEATKTRGIFDFFCLVQFCVHVLVSLIIQRIKEIELAKWWDQNKVKPIKNFGETPEILKMEVFLLFLTITGVIYQILFADDFERILIPQLKIEKILRSIKYWRIVIMFLNSNLFTGTKAIILCTKNAVSQTLPFILVYFLFVLMFSLIGFNLFSLQDAPAKQISFNSVYESVIFVLLTFYNEEWDSNMLNEYPQNGILIVVFQFLSIFIGIIILSKYYLAILMKYLGDELDGAIESQKDPSEPTNKVANEDIIEEEIVEEDAMEKEDLGGLEKEVEKEKKKKKQYSKSEFVHDIGFNPNRVQPLLHNSQDYLLRKRRQEIFEKNTLNVVQFKEESVEDQISELKFSTMGNPHKQKKQEEERKKKKTENKIKAKTEPSEKNEKEEKQELVEEPGKCLETKLFLERVLVSNVYLGYYIVLILLSLVEVWARDPFRDPGSAWYQDWGVVEKVTSVLFLMDLLMSIGIFGVCKSEDSYFKRRKTNILNFVLVILCVPTIFPTVCDIFLIHKLGRLKVLRFCIFVDIFSEKNANMRFTIISFAKLFPKLIKLFLMICIFYGFFAIAMVKLYSNEFYHCSGMWDSTEIATKNDCLEWGGDWVEYEFNTNNTFNSLLYLLMVASTEGWVSLMVPMASIKGEHLQPQMHENYHIRLFFLFFFFFGNMIVLNVFIGLSIQTMKDIKKDESGESSLTKYEKEWLVIREKIYRTELYPRKIPENNTCKYYIYVLTNHMGYKVFKILIMACYMVLMGIQYSDPSVVITIQIVFVMFSLVTSILETIGTIKRRKKFITLFIIGFFLYFLVFNCLYYFTEAFHNTKWLRIFGSVLIGLQLFKYWTYIYQIPYVRKTLKFLNIIIPHVAYTMVLMCTIWILYGYLGVELFSFLKGNTELRDYDQNYRNLENALFSLIKFSTWEAPIAQISNAGMELGPHFVCFQISTYEEYLKYGLNGCGSKVKSYLYFITFHIIYSIILMSSFTATIFDGYTEVKKQEEELINEFQLEEVTDEWLNYDPEATGFLAYHNFWRFVSKLHKIYQLSDEKVISTENKSSFLARLNIPVYSNESVLGFEYYETIESLTRIMLSKKYGMEIKTSRPDQIFKERNSLHLNEYELRTFTSEHVFIIILLRQGLRQWRNKAIRDFVPGIFNNVFFRANN